MARVKTENIAINNTWQQIEFEICANIGSYELEIMRADTQPTKNEKGYILKVGQGLSRNELPYGSNTYFISRYRNGLLAVD